MVIGALEKAAAGDRDEIVALFQRAVEHLNQSGIPQWDEVYPRAENVDEDIQNGELYIARAETGIAGVITLNQSFDPAYNNGQWLYSGLDFMVVHRLCVSPEMQGFGVGSRMMRLAEEMLAENGVKSIRMDAFTRNPHSLKLYEKLGYSVVGEARWRKGLFYLMEKVIAV